MTKEIAESLALAGFLLLTLILNKIIDWIATKRKEKRKRENINRWEIEFKTYLAKDKTWKEEMRGWFDKMFTIQEQKMSLFEGRIRLLELRAEEHQENIEKLFSIVIGDNTRIRNAKEPPKKKDRPTKPPISE